MASPDAGDIQVAGRSVLGLSPDARETGVAFQNFALYPHMNAFENMASPLRARGASEAEVKKTVEATGELLKIGHVLHHFPRQLSNGQKQRTALGRALVRRPKIILLDDPLRNVDAKLRYEMRLELPRLLKRFESTVLYVTQDYKEAMALGERVAVLFGGRFQQTDHPATIYKNPRHVEIARLFGDPTINLYPIRQNRGADGPEATVLGQRLRLADSARLERPCLIGIRPEDVHVDQTPFQDSFPVELDAVTPLNVRTVLFLRTREREEVFATCSESNGERFGRGHKQVHARIDFHKALYFDEATGERLAA